jgi:shikimate dehydrogenase
MKIYGIFGDPIEHSLSPAMHNAAFRALDFGACYHAFLVTKDRLRSAIMGADSMGFGGLNLTIPLKEDALEIITPDKLAEAIGAINTVSFGRQIRGHNTDGIGAVMALEESGTRVKGSRVLLIGAGGAAKAIGYTLANQDAEISIVNRNSKRAGELASRIGAKDYGFDELESLVKQADIVINATSVGMRDGDPRLFQRNVLRRNQTVFDIVYNRDTELIKDAIASQAKAIDGVMMLVYQGAKALEIWTGFNAPVKIMEKAVRTSLKAKKEHRVE